MAYRYKEIKSLDEAYPDEQVCAVYNQPINNFTAIVSDKRLVEALGDKNCKLVVWRNDDDPNYYQGINEFGQIREMRYNGKPKQKMTYYEENLIEIAWIHQQLCSSNSYHNTDFDSRDAKMEIISIAQDFEKKFDGTDWDNGKLDYYEEIEDFAAERLMKWNA